MSAGTIPLSQYRTNVRGLLGDQDYEATLVDQAINWYNNRLHLNNRIRYMETNDQLYVSDGDTNIEFPDDFQRLIGLWLTSPQVADLSKTMVEYNIFMRLYSNFASSNAQQIYSWTMFGTGMRFSAPSKTAATMNIDYLRVPTLLVEDDDTTDLPDAYEELLSRGAVSLIMAINEDYTEAANEDATLQRLRLTFVQNEGRGGGTTMPRVMSAGHGRRQWRADKDF